MSTGLDNAARGGPDRSPGSMLMARRSQDRAPAPLGHASRRDQRSAPSDAWSRSSRAVQNVGLALRPCWWDWMDLNHRPLPYQGSLAKGCDLHLCSSAGLGVVTRVPLSPAWFGWLLDQVLTSSCGGGRRPASLRRDPPCSDPRYRWKPTPAAISTAMTAATSNRRPRRREATIGCHTRTDDAPAKRPCCHGQRTRTPGSTQIR